MSIDGRITVDALFHDRSGQRLKVLSLASSTGYTTGKVVFVTATAGYSAGITWNNYRNAAGQLVALNDPAAVAFSWSGSTYRTLSDSVNSNVRIMSKDGQVTFGLLNPNEEPGFELTAAEGDTATTGTYTIIMWGAD